VQRAGQLVAIHRAVFRKSHRQIPVAAPTFLVNQRAITATVEPLPLIAGAAE
jgi:hypothetical protein